MRSWHRCPVDLFTCDAQPSGLGVPRDRRTAVSAASAGSDARLRLQRPADHRDLERWFAPRRAVQNGSAALGAARNLIIFFSAGTRDFFVFDKFSFFLPRRTVKNVSMESKKAQVAFKPQPFGDCRQTRIS